MPNHTRRSFFKSLVAETISFVEELNGKPQFRLDELKNMPDNVLLEMIPIFNEAIPSKVEDGRLFVRREKNAEFGPCQNLGDRETYILERFDGGHSIAGIRDELVAEFEIESDTAFAEVRNLFVRLAEAGICRPAGGHE